MEKFKVLSDFSLRTPQYCNEKKCLSAANYCQRVLIARMGRNYKKVHLALKAFGKLHIDFGYLDFLVQKKINEIYLKKSNEPK